MTGLRSRKFPVPETFFTTFPNSDEVISMPSEKKTALVLSVLLFLGVVIHAMPQARTQTASAWISGAVQWDAIWGTELMCESQKFNLDEQLKLKGNHTFKVETARSKDRIVALLPELHRLVTIRLMGDQELASITIASTCEGSLDDYYAKLNSFPREKSVQDPLLQQRLQKLEQRAQSQNAGDMARELGTLQVTVPILRPTVRRAEWSKTKLGALSSIEAAIQKDFDEQCERGEAGEAEIPDFELNDPRLLVLRTTKEGTCILPIGFERRKGREDPYTAYAEYHCSQDSEQLAKVQRLIRAHRAATRTLACHAKP